MPPDNTRLNVGSGGDLISTNVLPGGEKVQRVKVQFGDPGSAADVTPTLGLPIEAVPRTHDWVTFSGVVVDAPNGIELVAPANATEFHVFNEGPTGSIRIEFEHTGSAGFGSPFVLGGGEDIKVDKLSISRLRLTKVLVSGVVARVYIL